MLGKKIRNAIICGAIMVALGGTCFSGNVIASEAQAAVTATDVAMACAETNYDEYEFADDMDDLWEIDTDGDVEVIEDGDPILGSASSGKTTTKKTSKTKKYTGKLSSSAPKSKTVTHKNTKISTRYGVESKKAVTTQTKVVTTTKTKYKRGSRTTNITQTVATTVKKTTSNITKKNYNIKNIATKADEALLDRFVDEGYEFQLDNSISAQGIFSYGGHRIAVQTVSGTVVYHELGHYLARTTGNTDLTKEWTSIYNAEKSKYNGVSKSYIQSNQREYYAESYRDYVLNNSQLKKERPKTYAYLKKILASIQEDDE